MGGDRFFLTSSLDLYSLVPKIGLGFGFHWLRAFSHGPVIGIGLLVRLNIRRLVVPVLVAALISMSVAQAVAVSRGDGAADPVASSMHGQDHRHHDHMVADEKSKRDCLDFCAEDVSDGFFAASSPELSIPLFTVSYPLPAALRQPRTDLSSIAKWQLARGPPFGLMNQHARGLQGLLLRNARVRN